MDEYYGLVDRMADVAEMESGVEHDADYHRRKIERNARRRKYGD